MWFFGQSTTTLLSVQTLDLIFHLKLYKQNQFAPSAVASSPLDSCSSLLHRISCYLFPNIEVELEAAFADAGADDGDVEGGGRASEGSAKALIVSGGDVAVDLRGDCATDADRIGIAVVATTGVEIL